MSLSSNTRTAEKILARIKGLRNHMQLDEEPLLAVPAIWDNGQGQRATPCEVIVTNQRLLGYVFVTFPRERLFLEALPLSTITTISVRQRTFEPLFRELLVSDGQRKIYIRTPQKKIEALYAALRAATEQYTSLGQATVEEGQTENTPPTTPIYGRQDIRISFENSPLAIALLFVGGLVLELVAAVLWAITSSVQVGLPLFIAGLLAVITAILVKRQRS